MTPGLRMRVAPGIGFLGQDDGSGDGGSYGGVDYTAYDPGASAYPGPYDPSASAGTGGDPSSYFPIDPYAYDPTAGQPAGPFVSSPGSDPSSFFQIDPYAYGPDNPSASSASSPSPMAPAGAPGPTNKPHTSAVPSHAAAPASGGGGGGGNPLDALKALFGRASSTTTAAAGAFHAAPPVNTVFGLSAGYFVLLAGGAVALYLFTRKRGR